MSKRKLLFLDDHRVILDGLALLTETLYEVQAVDSLPEFEAALEIFQPDLVLIDIQLEGKDGFQVAQDLLARRPHTKIAFLSAHSESRMLRRATDLGARGYLSKRSSADELMLAIQTILNGGKYIAPRNAEDEHLRSELTLTERQKEVLRLIARGYSAKEIAGELNISARTAEFHRAEIMERLSLHSTAMMTRYAIEHGIV